MSDLKEHFARLVDHLEWADQRALTSLRAAANAPAKAVETYAHILGSEHVWLSRLYGMPARVAVWPTLTLDECERLAAENAAQYRKVVDGLTDEALDRGITYRNSAGDQFTSTVQDILTHVFMHGSYHRGQVASKLKRFGVEQPTTDFFWWVMEQIPQEK